MMMIQIMVIYVMSYLLEIQTSQHVLIDFVKGSHDENNFLLMINSERGELNSRRRLFDNYS